MRNTRTGIRAGVFGAVFLAAALFLTGCVDQHSEGTRAAAQTETETVDSLLEITDPVEKQAVEVAKAKVHSMEGTPKIVATSPATAEICDKLELDLAGVCSSTTSTIPKRYKDVTTVGTAMSPDMEIVASLNPDWILSPVSLQSDLEPKYENIGVDWAFLNLRSVHDLTYENFGMSANFRYPKALKELQPILYPEDASGEASEETSKETTKKEE